LDSNKRIVFVHPRLTADAEALLDKIPDLAGH